MSTWLSLLPPLTRQKTYEITELLPDTEYTVSINGTHNSLVEVWLTTLNMGENGIIETEVNQNNAVYVGDLENNKLTFVAQELHTALVMRATGDLELNTIQLEKGNIATDWTPAPEEQEQRLSIVEQTANGTKTSLQDLQSEFEANMRYEIKEIDGEQKGVLELGEFNSPFKVWIWNERISFIQDDNEVAYVSNNKLYITNGQFLNSLRIGNFSFTPRTNGNLSFGKVV